MPTGSKLSWTTAAGVAETSKHTRLDLWRKDFCLGGLQLLHSAPLSLRVVPSFSSSTSGMAAQSRAVWEGHAELQRTLWAAYLGAGDARLRVAADRAHRGFDGRRGGS